MSEAIENTSTISDPAPPSLAPYADWIAFIAAAVREAQAEVYALTDHHHTELAR